MTLTCGRCGRHPKFVLGRSALEALPLRFQSTMRRPDGRHVDVVVTLCRECISASSASTPELAAVDFLAEFFDGQGAAPELAS